jgi:hypothetical protein
VSEIAVPPRRPRFGPVFILAALVVAASCSSAEPGTGSTETGVLMPEAGARAPCAGHINRQGIDPTTTDQIQAAIRFRRENGLPAGVPYVLAMACVPDANVDFGVPLSPAEIAEFQRRGQTVDTMLPAVQAYADSHGDEFGGLYIDQARGGVLTVLWTARIDEHLAALRALVHPRAPIAVRQVRWTERELAGLQARIAADWNWFRAIPAAPRGVGIDTINNVVQVSVSSANASASEMIVAHYGVAPGMIVVESDGTGAALLPWGTVKGVVVTKKGKPPGSNNLMVEQALGGVPGECGGGDVGFGVMDDGRFEYPCQAGVRVIEVVEIGDAEPHPVLGSGRVTVKANEVASLRIVIDEPARP